MRDDLGEILQLRPDRIEMAADVLDNREHQDLGSLPDQLGGVQPGGAVAGEQDETDGSKQEHGRRGGERKRDRRTSRFRWR